MHVTIRMNQAGITSALEIDAIDAHAKQGRLAGEGFRRYDLNPETHRNCIRTLPGEYSCVSLGPFQPQGDSTAGGGSPSL